MHTETVFIEPGGGGGAVKKGFLSLSAGTGHTQRVPARILVVISEAMEAV